MNTQPKVSVIVPNYNHQAFLKERIDTILQQTYQDFELIILDDCSIDNSVSIIESYRNNEHVTHIVLNDQNTGSTFKQWDKGVSLARGEYIWIAESDDAAHPEFLATLVGQLESHPEAVLAYAYSLIINEKGEKINKKHNISDGTVKIYNGLKYAHWAMLPCNNIYNASMVVFRRDVYDKVDKSFMQYRYVGDWKFWMSVCLLGGYVVEVRQFLNYFREHYNKVTVKCAQEGRSWSEVVSVLRSFIPQLGLKGIRLQTFRGRWTRDFDKCHVPNKEIFAEQNKDIIKASQFDILLHKVLQTLFKIYRYG